ncbi:MAG: spore coat protein CotJB [Tepidanaerobacteraceae bacterium]|nr:spore coat protein CotJB [Tepidanaerobacteraceae bacterium]HQE06034.1 spore coat protein CotJB [Tepidanaerobacteraceae bacterium]
MYSKDMVDLLKEIMAVDFVVYELALFLNTHPTDRRALEDHNNFARRSQELRAMYEKKYGPLTLGSVSEFPYQYINNPWPWEIRY